MEHMRALKRDPRELLLGPTIEVSSVINLSEALGRIAAGLFMTDG